jgi:hypothetical protein
MTEITVVTSGYEQAAYEVYCEQIDKGVDPIRAAVKSFTIVPQVSGEFVGSLIGSKLVDEVMA